jgi:hypothetical protein
MSSPCEIAGPPRISLSPSQAADAGTLLKASPPAPKIATASHFNKRI